MAAFAAALLGHPDMPSRIINEHIPDPPTLTSMATSRCSSGRALTVAPSTNVVEAANPSPQKKKGEPKMRLTSHGERSGAFCTTSMWKLFPEQRHTDTTVEVHEYDSAPLQSDAN